MILYRILSSTNIMKNTTFAFISKQLADCDKYSGCIWTVIVHKILEILLNLTVYMGKKLKRLAQIWKHLHKTYIHY